jgi:hypothetical protein
MLRLSCIRSCRSWNFTQFVVDLLSLHRTIQDLRKSGSSATLTRLFESKHVRDLKLIAGTAAWIVLGGAVAYRAFWKIVAAFIRLEKPALGVFYHGLRPNPREWKYWCSHFKLPTGARRFECLLNRWSF